MSFNGQSHQDVITRNGQQMGGILVTYVSYEDALSSRDGLRTYKYRLPFQVFGLASPNGSTDGSTREPSHNDVTIVIRMIPRLFCL